MVINYLQTLSYQTVETTDEDEVITSPDIIDPLTKEVIIPGYKYTTKKKVVKEEQYKIKKAFYTKDKDFIILPSLSVILSIKVYLYKVPLVASVVAYLEI